MTRPYLGQAACLALGAAAALGFARFAYGLLVPAMRAELGWSLAQSGAMTTANGLGYLGGALVTGLVVRRLGAAGTFRLGMILTAFSLAATTIPNDVLLLLGRAAAGATGALVFISGGVIAARRGQRPVGRAYRHLLLGSRAGHRAEWCDHPPGSRESLRTMAARVGGPGHRGRARHRDQLDRGPGLSLAGKAMRPGGAGYGHCA